MIVGADLPSKPVCCAEILQAGSLEQHCTRSVSGHSIQNSAPVACKAANRGVIAKDTSIIASTRAWIGLLA